MENIIKRSKNGNIKMVAGDSYHAMVQGKTLLKLRDTGNGVVVKFPSVTSIMQDNYVCLDYDEAQMLYLALRRYYRDEAKD